MDKGWLTVGALALGLAAAEVSAQNRSAVEAQDPRRVTLPPTESAPAAENDTRPAAPAAVGRIQARPAAPVESVVPELERIVVLCATDPESDELEQAWVAYVEEHGIAESDLDSLVGEVMRRAAAHRADQPARSRNTRLANPDATRKMLHDTAMAVIRKIG